MFVTCLVVLAALVTLLHQRGVLEHIVIAEMQQASRTPSAGWIEPDLSWLRPTARYISDWSEIDPPTERDQSWSERSMIINTRQRAIILISSFRLMGLRFSSKDFKRKLMTSGQLVRQFLREESGSASVSHTCIVSSTWRSSHHCPF
jgi:hypothetical protein